MSSAVLGGQEEAVAPLSTGAGGASGVPLVCAAAVLSALLLAA